MEPVSVGFLGRSMSGECKHLDDYVHMKIRCIPSTSLGWSRSTRSIRPDWSARTRTLFATWAATKSPATENSIATRWTSKMGGAVPPSIVAACPSMRLSMMVWFTDEVVVSLSHQSMST